MYKEQPKEGGREKPQYIEKHGSPSENELNRNTETSTVLPTNFINFPEYQFGRRYNVFAEPRDEGSDRRPQVQGKGMKGRDPARKAKLFNARGRGGLYG